MAIFRKSNKNRPLAKAPRFYDSPLRLLAVSVESVLDKFYRRARKALGSDGIPLMIEQHNAIGFPGGVYVRGRVLATIERCTPSPTDSAWINLSRMLKHWLTDEEPFARIEVKCGREIREITADEEGYFEVVFDQPGLPRMFEIEVRLPDSFDLQWHVSPIYTPPENFRHLIVSDIDDTVLRTDVVSTWKMLKTTFFGNVLTREIFPGTPEFYKIMTANGNNPVFFVTSSPWNLWSFLQSLFLHHELPKGTFFMTDWGLDKEKWFTKSHDEHKTQSIEKILSWHPGKPVVLLGDSGQEDPEIYRALAEKFPDQIRLILIRNVTRLKKRRERQVIQMARACQERGIPMHLCNETREMEKHYAEVFGSD